MKKCPFCAEEIQDEAVVCKHCGRDIPDGDQPDMGPAEPATATAQVAPTGVSEPGAPEPTARRGKSVKLILVGVGVLVFLGAGFLVLRPRASQLEKAYKTCDEKLSSMQGVSLADGGASLVISGPTQDEATLDPQAASDSIAAIACVLKELHVPAYVQEQIDTTSSLMGRQEADWDGLKASWSFHPDTGEQMTIVNQ
jgi:hypothetical protein